MRRPARHRRRRPLGHGLSRSDRSPVLAVLVAGVVAGVLIVGYVVGLPSSVPTSPVAEVAGKGDGSHEGVAQVSHHRNPPGADHGGKGVTATPPPMLVAPSPSHPKQVTAAPSAPVLGTKGTRAHSPRTTTDGADGPVDRSAAPTPRAWRAVLASIDARRRLAWHRGDPSALRSVFAPGSHALAADTQALMRYVRRGLHVDGVSTSYRVVQIERVTAGSATVVVVDRLGQAVARDSKGRSARLPYDRPSRQRITLQRVGGTWLIASVTSA